MQGFDFKIDYFGFYRDALKIKNMDILTNQINSNDVRVLIDCGFASSI